MKTWTQKSWNRVVIPMVGASGSPHALDCLDGPDSPGSPDSPDSRDSPAIPPGPRTLGFDATVGVSPDSGTPASSREHRVLGALRTFLQVALVVALVPAAVAAQGWIEPPPDRTRTWGVERLRTEVRVEVKGRTARVVVQEWFRNNGGRVAEGDYHYPLPGHASFDSFSLYQGETELRGEIMDAERARHIYEEIVRKRRDPALIELAGHGLLRARVFPIEPGDTRRVTLRYDRLLDRAGDALHFEYAAPSGAGDAGPRPTPRPVPPRTTAPPAGQGRHVIEDRAPLRFEMTVEEGDRFLEPFSPTHALDSSREDDRLRVRTRGPVEGSLSVYLPLAREGVSLALTTHARIGEDGYFMLTLSPGEDEPVAVPRDLTVVLDVSGSMSGQKIEQARSALAHLLGTLDQEDRFRLVAFSSAVRPHSLELVPATPERVEEARRWVEGLVADGGTNIGAALDEAFRESPPGDHLPIVVFLTDGIPSVGERSVDRIIERAREARGESRIFSFGVGHDVNTELLDRLTEAGRGATSYVQPGESVELELSLLAEKIRHPVLTDLAFVETPGRFSEIYPVEIPDVFAGEELVLFGRYERPGETSDGTLVLEGRRGDRRRTFSADIRLPERDGSNGFLPRLWASRKLGFLTRRVWTEGESPELVEEIRRVALRHGLPSAYTSYLVTEPGTHGRRLRLPSPSSGAAAGAPVPSRGRRAVEMADEARKLRDVASSAELSTVEQDVVRFPGTPGNASIRKVAGRLFVLEEGVWKDTSATPDGRMIPIAPYSRGYFELLRALPEIRSWWSAFEQVHLAAGKLVLALEPGGSQELTESEIRRIADEFLQDESTRP